MKDNLWWKTTLYGGQPLTEDNLWWKITVFKINLIFAFFAHPTPQPLTLFKFCQAKIPALSWWTLDSLFIVPFAFCFSKSFFFLQTFILTTKYHFWDLHHCFRGPVFLLTGPALLLPDLDYFTVTFLSRKIKQKHGIKPDRHNHKDILLLGKFSFLSGPSLWSSHLRKFISQLNW